VPLDGVARATRMSSTQIHTIRRNGIWVNVIEGKGRVAGEYRTKDEASAAGHELASALDAQHVIHNIDGSIAARLAPGRRW
jgi:Uncharacterized protein conserved in bacteria (DUF2188)